MTRPGCPICGKTPDPAYRPFCSRRCADVDLQRWLSGAYAVPAEEDDGPAEPQIGED
jgi:endogenous inhibitor of DNA gyrase (YacG/DUF329 family)